MRSILTRATLVAVGMVALVGGTASASVGDVTIPFPFVVQGQRFPAGHYRVERDMSSAVVIRGDNSNTASMYVLTMPAPGTDPSGDTPALTFRRYENQYRLADVWESGNQGREIAAREYARVSRRDC